MAHSGESKSSVRPWKITSSGEEEDFQIFRIRRDVAVSPRTGESHQRVVVLTPDWVNVVAITPDAQVVMVEQYRHGISSVTLELPGGLIEAGESPVEAGLRELREETGFVGVDPQPLGSAHPNPAYFSNQCHFVVVQDAVQIGALQQDSGEDIALRCVPLADIPRLIERGGITHAVMIAAFYFLGLHGV